MQPPARPRPSLIRWLADVLVHGAAAGAAAGAVLLASGNGPAHLLSMQSQPILGATMFMYVCAQTGAAFALVMAACLDRGE